MLLDELMGWACIAAAADPGTPLVEAGAVFLAPAPEQAQALFPSLRQPR